MKRRHITSLFLSTILPLVLNVGAQAAVAAQAEGPLDAVKTAVTKQPSVPEDASREEGYLLLKDVPYNHEFKQDTGDLYLPADFKESGAQRYPAVMIVHGGAWVLGSKTDKGEVDIARRLAQHGYVVFSIDYRLVQDGGIYPKSIAEVNDALGYLGTHAKTLKIDPNRVGIFGGSAGAMMALLVAYAPADTQAFKAPHYDVSSVLRPKATVVYGALTDIRNLEKTWIIKYLDDTPWHSPDLYAQASPINYISTAVPTLCVHSDADITVPCEQSKELVELLKKNNVTNELLVVPKAKHYFHEIPGPKRELAFQHLLDFFNANLGSR